MLTSFYDASGFVFESHWPVAPRIGEEIIVDIDRRTYIVAEVGYGVRKDGVLVEIRVKLRSK